jgi:hypothetical protein
MKNLNILILVLVLVSVVAAGFAVNALASHNAQNLFSSIDG